MILTILAASLVPAVCVAQKTAAPVRAANPDQLGMTCAQILQMSSTDWMTKYNAAKGPDTPATIRGIGVYGKCYDTRTDQLAAALGRSGKGPLMGAHGNFQSLQKALDDFKVKALANSQPPADLVKTAYAALYEKQFRYEFYESYAPKPVPAAPAAAAAGDTKKPGGRVDPNANDNDPVTLAKNHFGALLGDLPDEQMHMLHGSFGEILGANAATSHMQLLIYRYAIFLLEPAGEKPFASPPF